MSTHPLKHGNSLDSEQLESRPEFEPPLTALGKVSSSVPARRTLILSSAGFLATIVLLYSLPWTFQHQQDFIRLKGGQTGCQNFPISLTEDIDSQCSKLRPMNESYVIQDVLFGKGEQSSVRIVNEKDSGVGYVAMFVKMTRKWTLPRLLRRNNAVCGQPNIAQLVDLVCYNNSKVIPIFKKCGGRNIIDSYIPGETLDKQNCSRYSPKDIRRAIKGMFLGINQLIDVGICHQDFSIANAMFEPESGEFCVIDLGWAKQTRKYGECIGIDIDIPAIDGNEFDEERRRKIEQASWNVSILQNVNRPRMIRFRSDDTLSAIGVMGNLLSLPGPYVYLGIPGDAGYHLTEHIPRLLGREKVLDHVQKYNLTIPERLQQQLETMNEKPVDWKKLRNKCNEKVLTDDAVSFLEGFITLSFVDRLNFLRQAHKHPFLMNI